MRMAAALDHAAAKGVPLPVRYAVVARDLDVPSGPRKGAPVARGHEARCVRLAEAMSARLKVPLECRDAARLAARWHRSVDRAGELTPAALLDLLNAADALRRPERLDTLIDACESAALSLAGAGGDYPPGAFLRAALVVAKDVDAAAIARGAAKPRPQRKAGRDAIAAAVRAARIRALRAWKAAQASKG